jgi:hypothetical protein
MKDEDENEEDLVVLVLCDVLILLLDERVELEVVEVRLELLGSDEEVDEVVLMLLVELIVEVGEVDELVLLLDEGVELDVVVMEPRPLDVVEEVDDVELVLLLVELEIEVDDVVGVTVDAGGGGARTTGQLCAVTSFLSKVADPVSANSPP